MGKSRRLNRDFALVAVILLMLATGAWIRSELMLCGKLDRFFGRGTCVAEIAIADFDPLPFFAMVPRGDRTAWLYGYGPGDPAPPVRLLVDFSTGTVSERQEIDFLARTVYRLSSSLGDERMAVICMSGSVCDGLAGKQRPQGRVFSIDTGDALEDIPDAADWAGFSDAPQIPYEAAILVGRNLVAYADPDTGGVIVRDAANQTEIGRLVPVKSSRSGGPSRIDIWDVDSERLLNAFTIDGGNLETSAVWTRDERRLLVLKDRGNATDLYVLDVR